MSSRRIKPQEGLIKHTHCKNCGVSIPFGHEYCGLECETDYMHFKRREIYKTVGIIIVMIIVVVFVFLTNVVFG